MLIKHILLFQLLAAIDLRPKENYEEKCIKKILKSFSTNDILFYNVNKNWDLTFLNSFNSTMIVLNKTVIKTSIRKYTSILITITDTSKINEILGYFKLNKYSIFLLVGTFNENINYIFECAWQYSLLNFFVLHKGKIFTYFPYKNNCGERITYEIIGHCEETLESVLKYSKREINLKGCPVNILTLPYRPFVIDVFGDRNNPKQAGLEVTIMEIVAKKINFHPVYSQELHRKYHEAIFKGNFT